MIEIIWLYDLCVCAIFESLCQSRSSKALELTAAYLQVKKRTKEQNNNN